MRTSAAKDFMVTRLVTLPPHADVFDAIQLLLKHRITGAPVVDDTGKLLGVFSDKSCVTVLAAALSHRDPQIAVDPARVLARDVMVTRVTTVSPGTEALDAMRLLLKKQISGAPVTDDQGKFVGVFSERYAMRALVNSTYDQMPSMFVSECMNTDTRRAIDEDVNLVELTQIFVDNYFRRVCVVNDGTLMGLISRRDVLQAARKLKLLDDAGRDSVRQFTRTQLIYRNTPEDESHRVSTFMNKTPQTITEETDSLSMAHIFLNTNNRRLTVVRGQELVGQISRRDLLHAVVAHTAPPPEPKPAGLYLSAVLDREEVPLEGIGSKAPT